MVNSKIGVDDRIRLDTPITLVELDSAVSSSRTSSASGPDGMNYGFIKKFWLYLRQPLFKYANLCFQKGELTESFKTASIRLIPKKGDATKIKNWRPISLLNCIYKILSKAINTRLQSVTDIITSRAQKGFTSSRFIQEVLINLVEYISHCNTNGIPAIVLALDQSKAFDSIHHSYLKEVYKFFGMGENFIRMLSTVTEGRNAYILYDDGGSSTSFPLETGAPQGNPPSPVQYNFGEQILLLKIELDPRIASVFNHLFIPRQIPPLAINDARLGGGALWRDPA